MQTKFVTGYAQIPQTDRLKLSATGHHLRMPASRTSNATNSRPLHSIAKGADAVSHGNPLRDLLCPGD
ncbi:hypothetical protein CLE01_03960 [Cryobacterium levicorallinum]|uniref:Uncharacterized protein n=1 Tax=Cryobacterium levicorallinum TaxID=995038 RepID=A0ABY1EBI4_9MICO|nr:hypothetical protein CLE01_03960 [Cryobacterium levicorallinum]SFH37113.1 hypothetical protein SAMN05216274_10439 [Cryobacterium levicorallinum]